MSKSNECYGKCIKKGEIFCSNASYSNGYCYQEGEDVKRVNMCSNDVGETEFNSLRVQVCPNEAHCYGGSYAKKQFAVPLDGKKVHMTEVANEDAADDFINGDVCTYVVEGPARGVKGDLLNLVLQEMKNGDAYLHSGTQFNAATAASRKKLQRGKLYTVQMPAKLYISVFAQEIFFSRFYLETWYEPAPTKPKDPIVPVDTNVTIPTNTTTNTTTPVLPPQKNDTAIDPNIDPVEDPKKIEVVPLQQNNQKSISLLAVILIAVGFVLLMLAAIGGYLWHLKKLKEKKRQAKLSLKKEAPSLEKQDSEELDKKKPKFESPSQHEISQHSLID